MDRHSHKLLMVQSGNFKYYICTKCEAEIWENAESFASNLSLNFKMDIFKESSATKDSLPTKNSGTKLPDRQEEHAVLVNGDVYLINSSGRLYSKYTCWLSDEDYIVRNIIE